MEEPQVIHGRKTDDPVAGDLVGTDITELLKYKMLRNVAESLVRIILWNDHRSEGYTRCHFIDWILVTEVDINWLAPVSAIVNFSLTCNAEYICLDCVKLLLAWIWCTESIPFMDVFNLRICMNCEDDFLGAFAKFRSSYLSVCLSSWNSDWGVKLSTIFDLVPRLRIHGTLPPFFMCLYVVMLNVVWDNFSVVLCECCFLQ
jgi:hypothetical protein